MQNQESTQPNGNLKISRDVIATIARYAAMEIDGVASMASFSANLRGLLTKKQPPKPIMVEINDDVAVVELHLNLRSGVRIPEAAEKVQAAVKEAVQNMTGIAVAQVNVEISDIVFEEPVPVLQAQE